MAENPKTKHAILLAAGDSEALQEGNVIGKPGYVLHGTRYDRIEAHQMLQAVFYVVVGRDPAHVRSFSALAGMKELP
jgi:hypothetical protein